MRRPTPRAAKPEHTGATDEAEQAEVAPDLAVEVAPDELDLAKLAAALRRVIPRVDESSRERLESAWVALTNAMSEVAVATLNEPALLHDVTQAVGEPGVRGFAVAARTARLLVVAFDGFR